MKIFVAKLNFKTKSSDLQNLFEQYGQVDSAKVIVDRDSNKSKGFGFVEMPNATEAMQAINALHETDFDGRTIVVQESEERAARDRRR